MFDLDSFAEYCDEWITKIENDEVRICDVPKDVRASVAMGGIMGFMDDLIEKFEEDDYADKAKIVMRRSDYFDIIEALANGNATLYQAQPESVLGAPVIFCDLATIPVVGDFSYSHFNYDLDATYESDKNIRTGITSFVLTGYLDHKIKMKSAFRLALVQGE